MHSTKRIIEFLRRNESRKTIVNDGAKARTRTTTRGALLPKTLNGWTCTVTRGRKTGTEGNKDDKSKTYKFASRCKSHEPRRGKKTSLEFRSGKGPPAPREHARHNENAHKRVRGGREATLTLYWGLRRQLLVSVAGRCTGTATCPRQLDSRTT